ncbi:hypothetical protein BGZ46_009137 [Entomortierella lignicola]|nr:hypothetical protein BGZ46_009137 [Entomortierella lignicola]
MLCSASSLQSTRRLATTTAQSLFNKNVTFTSNITTQSMSMRRFHHDTILNNRFTSSFNTTNTTSTLSSLLSTEQISARSSIGSVSASTKATFWSKSLQSRPFISSRKYTSSSSPTSSSSTSTTVSSASAARILAEESSHVAANTTTAVASSTTSKVPLTFHEEMTKVRFSYNWWKEWSIIMVVFAVTGSSTVMVVRPLLKNGRRPYFKKVVLRMWGRFLPKKITQRFH